MQVISINQTEISESLAQLSTAEEAAITGGARLVTSEFISVATPGASATSGIKSSTSGTFVTTQYSLGSSIRTSSGIAVGKRSFFFGQLRDFF